MPTKVLFDTSVLVPALADTHPHHSEARPRLERARSNDVELFVSAHALAETYSTLTVFPVAPAISPAEAVRLINEDVLAVAEVVPLDADDYAAVLDRMAALGLVSGAVYDGLHVRAAEKAGADELVTFNGRDFLRMPPAPPCRLVVL